MLFKTKNNGCLKGCGISILVILGLFIVVTGVGFINFLMEASYESASSLYTNKEYLKAKDQINILLAKDSLNPSLHFLKGKITFKLGDSVASEKLMHQAITLSDNLDLKWKISKAVFDWEIQKKDTAQAVSILLKPILFYKKRDYKKYIETHYNVAEIFEKVKLADSSIMVLNRLLDSISIKYIDTSLYQKTHYRVSTRLFKLRDTIGATNALEKIAKEIATSKIAYERLGDFYRGKSQHRKAITYYKNYIKVDTTNALVYTKLGHSFLNIKHKKSAINYFKIGTRKGNSDACSQLKELTARTRYRTISVCCDGSTSSSTGRGTCSHHRGVCSVKHIPYKEYTMYCTN